MSNADQPAFKDGLDTDFWGYITGTPGHCPEDGFYARVDRVGEDLHLTVVECKKGDALEAWLVAGPLTPRQRAWCHTHFAQITYMEDLRVFSAIDEAAKGL